MRRATGKQSLARLAAYIAGAYTFQITITKTYNVTNLLEDIRVGGCVAGRLGGWGWGGWRAALPLSCGRTERPCRRYSRARHVFRCWLTSCWPAAIQSPITHPPPSRACTRWRG